MSYASSTVEASQRNASNSLAEVVAESHLLLRTVYSIRSDVEGSGLDRLGAIVQAYPETWARLTKIWPEHPVPGHPSSDVKYDKNERDGVTVIQREAANVLSALQPAVTTFKEVAAFLDKAERLLADLHQCLMPLTVGMAPTLLRAYMQLFCNCCRAAMLLREVPRKLVMQLYTLAHVSRHGRDVPGREQTVAFLSACDSPAAMLQQRFQSISGRIGQVVELVLCPVLESLPQAEVLAASSLFDTFRSSQLGVLGLSPDACYRHLQHLDEYRSWALLGVLACPAVLSHARARDLTAALLREGYLLHVYRDMYEPLHPLFQQFVQPPLEALTTPDEGGAARGASARAQQQGRAGLVEGAWRDALAGCEREHRMRRHLACAWLTEMADLHQDQPQRMAADLPALVAALAYARGELLWYLAHVGEALPAPAPPAIKLGAARSAAVAEDAAAVTLLAAMCRAHAQIIRYHSALQCFLGERMRATLVQQLMRGVAAVGDAARGEAPSDPGRELTTLQVLMEGWAQLCEPDHDGGVAAPPPPGLLAHLEGEWLGLCVQLFGTHESLCTAQLQAHAKDPRFVDTIHQMLELAPYVASLERALHPCCSLQQLAFWPGKLRALLQAALATDSLPCLEACPAVLQALQWYELAGEGVITPRDYAEAAEEEARLLVADMCSALKTLVYGAVREASGRHSGAVPAPRPWRADPASDTAAPSVAGQGGGAAAPATGAPPPPTMLLRACCLASAMDALGSVRVSSRVAVAPRQAVCAALQQCLRGLLSAVAAHPQDVPPPSQLARRVRQLLTTVAQLRGSLSLDPLPGLWEVLLEHARLPQERGEGAADDADGGAPAASSAAPTVAGAYSAWLVARVVRDEEGRGVMYAPQAKRFTCAVGDADALLRCASLPELRELLQVLGPSAGQALASSVEQALAECLSLLDVQLGALAPVLSPIRQVLAEGGSCWELVQAAATQLQQSEAQALAPLKLLGRCVALRQLIGEALSAAMGDEFALLPAVAAAVAPATAASALYTPAHHIADVFGAPRPGGGADGAPGAADPAVTRLLLGNNSLERYQCWDNLPVLLGLALGGAGGAAAARYDPAARTLSNELHALAAAAQALALAQREAADRVLSHGSGFLHPHSASPAADALECLARVAVAAMHGPSTRDPATAQSAKQLVLGALVGGCLRRGTLAEVLLPPSRLWSAVNRAAGDVPPGAAAA